MVTESKRLLPLTGWLTVQLEESPSVLSIDNIGVGYFSMKKGFRGYVSKGGLLKNSLFQWFCLQTVAVNSLFPFGRDFWQLSGGIKLFFVE